MTKFSPATKIGLCITAVNVLFCVWTLAFQKGYLEHACTDYAVKAFHAEAAKEKS